MKRALVTGGCGFIGSNLTKELVNSGWPAVGKLMLLIICQMDT
jgi:nucleoside-diphosphate-sugar epimerase